jgi:hypothetical protein
MSDEAIVNPNEDYSNFSITGFCYRISVSVMTNYFLGVD